MTNTPIVYQKEDFCITTDLSRLDLAAVQAFLANSYWASVRPLDVIQKSLQNSICFSLFHGERQIGFARIVTDSATFAYLCDVYIDPDYRGQRLGHWLIDCILEHPDLRQLRRMILATRDAHEFYRAHGFRELSQPEKFMELTPNLKGANS